MYSEKLLNYINFVEKEIKRPIIIRETTDVGFKGMSAKVKYTSKELQICFIPERVGLNHIEEVIAHEATHGLLIYKTGYFNVVPKGKISKILQNKIDIISTMIDDIAVDRIIRQQGFKGPSTIYIQQVANENKFHESIYKKIFLMLIYEKFLLFTDTLWLGPKHII